MDSDFKANDFGDIDFGDISRPKSATQRNQEISAVLKSFKERAKAERDVFMENVDSEYWCCFCFQTRTQKEEFLQKLGLLELGDKYLDGIEVAKALKVPLDAPVPSVRKRNQSKRWLEFRENV